MRILLAASLLLLAACSGGDQKSGTVELLNVSYDPTRELYQDVNARFSARWKEQTGTELRIKMSHGGSGKQARSVIDGLQADVVTLALADDVDQIAQRTRLIPADWQTRLPHNSAPYTSTIVLLVRAGNPKQIHDWSDLVRPGVAVITPNPKTSGGARWNMLAAWAWAREAQGGEAGAEQWLRTMLANVPVFDAGARAATTTFVERRIGDVLIAWENEALLAQRQFREGGFEIVYPSVSILAEPSIAVVEGNAERRGTLEAARAYLQFLETAEGQDLIGKHYFRPRDPEALERYRSQFPEMRMVTVDEAFDGWNEANARFFANGALFDRLTEKAR